MCRQTLSTEQETDRLKGGGGSCGDPLEWSARGRTLCLGTVVCFVVLFAVN